MFNGSKYHLGAARHSQKILICVLEAANKYNHIIYGSIITLVYVEACFVENQTDGFRVLL